MAVNNNNNNNIIIINNMPSKPSIRIPMAILALGTVVAFSIAIIYHFDTLAQPWTQCSSPSSTSDRSLPTALCFAVVFFQTSLNSTRSRLEEAVITGFLAGLATITAIESKRCRRQHVERRSQKGPVDEKGRLIRQGRDSTNGTTTVQFVEKVTENVTIPWLLYNLAAGALAWQAIIIPSFLHDQASMRTATHRRQPPSRTTASEDVSVLTSVALGLLLPSTLMIANTMSTKTILGWLVFPVWISVIQGAVERVIGAEPRKFDKTKDWNQAKGLGTALVPYIPTILYSTVSHVLLAKNLLTETDDRDSRTRSAVLLLEIDHVAMFLAFLYWAWARTSMMTSSTSPKGMQSVLVTLLSSLFLGPGAGVCLGWVFADVCSEREEDRRPYHHSDALQHEDRERGSDDSTSHRRAPGTPTTTTEQRRPRARSSPKATGHFFGGPLAG